jgi:acylphosphatase
MAIWRMVFWGATDMDVQGVYLRQVIKEIADSKEFCVKGHTRNLKDGSVEVLCECDKATADKLFSSIKQAAAVKRIKIDENKTEPPTQKIFEFDSFDIVREDDLKEMVWALQGAGRTFKEQDDIKKEEALRGLFYELRALSDYALEMLEKNNHKRAFRMLSMENIMTCPPSGIDETIVSQIGDLYQRCSEINGLPKGHFNEDLKKELQEILSLSSALEDNLRKKGFK